MVIQTTSKLTGFRDRSVNIIHHGDDRISFIIKNRVKCKSARYITEASPEVRSIGMDNKSTVWDIYIEMFWILFQQVSLWTSKTWDWVHLPGMSWKWTASPPSVRQSDEWFTGCDSAQRSPNAEVLRITVIIPYGNQMQTAAQEMQQKGDLIKNSKISI